MQKNIQKNQDYRKHLGNSQNFLTRRALIQKILNLSSINHNDTIVEIGTGKGHLTQALCQRCGHLDSIELDQKLYEYAQAKLSHLDNLCLIYGDFLKYPLPAKGSYKVFSNIPYFITSQIMEKLTQAPNPPSEIWLIMEKGAAKRFAGLPRENVNSLLLKVSWEPEILYHFRREDFHPMPCVDSVLLHLKRKSVPDLPLNSLPAFRNFIEHSMRYGMWGRQGLLTKKQATTALKLAGLPSAFESGLTLYIQWLCLFRCYQRFCR